MKRSREKIIESILEICKEPVTLTRIVYLGNLNFQTVHPYINGLMASGCLVKVSDTHGKHYMTTEKGNQVLEHFRALREMLK